MLQKHRTARKTAISLVKLRRVLAYSKFQPAKSTSFRHSALEKERFIRISKSESSVSLENNNQGSRIHCIFTMVSKMQLHIRFFVFSQTVVFYDANLTRANPYLLKYKFNHEFLKNSFEIPLENFNFLEKYRYIFALI